VALVPPIRACGACEQLGCSHNTLAKSGEAQGACRCGLRRGRSQGNRPRRGARGSAIAKNFSRIDSGVELARKRPPAISVLFIVLGFGGSCCRAGNAGWASLTAIMSLGLALVALKRLRALGPVETAGRGLNEDQAVAADPFKECQRLDSPRGEREAAGACDVRLLLGLTGNPACFAYNRISSPRSFTTSNGTARRSTEALGEALHTLPPLTKRTHLPLGWAEQKAFSGPSERTRQGSARASWRPSRFTRREP
jgi:hypothetical protein